VLVVIAIGGMIMDAIMHTLEIVTTAAPANLRKFIGPVRERDTEPANRKDDKVGRQTTRE